MLRFGTDGVRGVALTEVTTAYVRSLGAAAATVIDGSTWLVARDTRESGPELEAALVAGLSSHGQATQLCGVLPTPALAWLSALHGLPAAMITASHNPYSDNGVKVFAAGGIKLSDAVEARIEHQLAAEISAPLGAKGVVSHSTIVQGAVERYVDHLVAMFAPRALAGMRVVIDCANGAMSVAAPAALVALGATVTVIHAEPNGVNINAACGATYPASLSAAVLEAHADAGLAFDGDGDRVIAVDGRGRVVDGDRLLALAALQMKAQEELTHNTVVVTVMSNLGFHRAMRTADINVASTDVGDRYVLEALEAGDFAVGGEQSGHIIYRHLATTGDGLLAGLCLLHNVQQTGTSLEEMAAAVMTSYPQVLVNVRVAERHPDVASELAVEIAAAEALLGGDGRVLVRSSGTEPLVRVMVEAPTDAAAREVADSVAAVVQARFGN